MAARANLAMNISAKLIARFVVFDICNAQLIKCDDRLAFRR